MKYLKTFVNYTLYKIYWVLKKLNIILWGSLALLIILAFIGVI